MLSGRPTTGLLLVWISPQAAEHAQAMRDWADFVHIRHIAASGLPGFTQITPYENSAPGDPRYMHFYELDADDPEAAYLSMARHMARYFGGARTEAFVSGGLTGRRRTGRRSSTATPSASWEQAARSPGRASGR